MKKLALMMVLVASIVFYIGCKCCDDDPQTKPEEDVTTTGNVPDIEIEIKDIEPFKYVCIEETGSFDKMQSTISKFWMEAGKQKVIPAGAMIGVYYCDPNTTPESEWKWEVGIRVAGDVKVQEPLKLKEWKHTKIASYVAFGPYDETEGKYYPALYSKAANMGYVPGTPSMSVYHNDPNTVKPEEIKTEMIIPVEKFKIEKHPATR